MKKYAPRGRRTHRFVVLEKDGRAHVLEGRVFVSAVDRLMRRSKAARKILAGWRNA
jgi:hypothetical protein